MAGCDARCSAPEAHAPGWATIARDSLLDPNQAIDGGESSRSSANRCSGVFQLLHFLGCSLGIVERRRDMAYQQSHAYRSAHVFRIARVQRELNIAFDFCRRGYRVHTRQFVDEEEAAPGTERPTTLSLSLMSG